MNKTKLLIVLSVLLMAVSCAHKSGHVQTERARHRSSVPAKTPELSVPSTLPVGQSNNKFDGVEIFRMYSSAVFMIFTSDGAHNYQGSGFFIGKNGLAVSNYHVFKGTGIGAEAIKMPNDDKAYKVTKIYQRSDDEDFIIFRVGYDNDTYIPIASKRPEIGQRVFAIGSPRGLENTFSSGEVSQWRGKNLMQISALIDHGSSGGALINEYGEAVGITSGSFADGSQANLNYAWSIEVVKPYIKFE